MDMRVEEEEEGQRRRRRREEREVERGTKGGDRKTNAQIRIGFIAVQFQES